MRFYRPIALLATLALLAPAAHAADADANAAKLKTIFQNFIEYQKSLTAMNPNAPKLETEGDITVQKAESYYAVTLPHERLAYPDGSKLDFGMLSINASPGDTPGQWKIALAIPTPIVLFDAQRQPSIKINIGAQKAAGVWDESLENFAKLDAAYKDVTITSATNAFMINLPDSQIRYDFTKQSDGRWSGPATVVLNNIDGVFSANNAHLKIAQASMDCGISRYNVDTVKAYRAKITTLAQGAPNAPPGQLASDQRASLSKMLIDLIINASDGMKVNYAVNGLEMSMTNPATKAPETTRLAKASVSVNADGLLSDKSNIAAGLSFDGFNMDPQPSGYDGILPSTLNIVLNFHNIPTRQLAKMASNTIDGAIQQPDTAGMAGLSLMMKAPGLLSQAGTTLDVPQNYIGNNEYRFDVSGGARADVNAVNDFTGEFKGAFKGLDKLIASTQALAAGGSPAAPNAQSVISTLMMLKLMGKPQMGANGQNNYSYDLVITPQGQILMNGKPLGAPVAAQPTAPSPPAITQFKTPAAH